MNVGVAAVRGTDPDGRTLGVAAGDVAAIVGVLTVGLFRHEVNPVAAPDHAAVVMGPFLVGWLLTSVPTGAYALETLDSPRATVVSALLAWVAAALVGVAVRALPQAPGNSPPIFVAVVVGFGALAVGGWRVLWTFVRG